MTIDIEHEELVHFPDATKAFPGKKKCVQTLHRYRLRGVRGVVLETCVVGGLRYTSTEAIQRFVAAQNRAEPPNPQVTDSQQKMQAEPTR